MLLVPRSSSRCRRQIKLDIALLSPTHCSLQQLFFLLSKSETRALYVPKIDNLRPIHPSAEQDEHAHQTAFTCPTVLDLLPAVKSELLLV